MDAIASIRKYLVHPYTEKPLNFFRTHGATTRKMPSHDKLRKRLEEEYDILYYIKQTFGITTTEYRRRMKFIITLYSASFTKKQII